MGTNSYMFKWIQIQMGLESERILDYSCVFQMYSFLFLVIGFDFDYVQENWLINWGNSWGNIVLYIRARGSIVLYIWANQAHSSWDNESWTIGFPKAATFLDLYTNNLKHPNAAVWQKRQILISERELLEQNHRPSLYNRERSLFYN